jgi:drug/metabolite transporter (DMT)-like permease
VKIEPAIAADGAPETRMSRSTAGPAAQPGRERRGVIFGLLAAVIWGGYLAVTRQGIGAGLAASDLAFLRYATAGAVMLPWLIQHNVASLAGVGWRRGGVLAILAGPLFVLVGASGFTFAPLAHSAVIQLGTLTFMAVTLSALLVGEVPGRRQVAGLVIIITGLAVTAGPGLAAGGSAAWKGDLLFAAAGSMWALFTVLQRRWRISAMAATAVVSVLSALFYVPGYLAWRGLLPILQAGPAVVVQQAIVMGILSGVVALFAFGRAVEHLGPGRAALFPALAPAIAILAGIPLTGEIPNAIQITGLAILSLGLLLALRCPRSSSTPERRARSD